MKNLIIILGLLFITSCGESNDPHFVTHAQRMADLEYYEELSRVLEYAELQLLVYKLDSISMEMDSLFANSITVNGD